MELPHGGRHEIIAHPFGAIPQKENVLYPRFLKDSVKIFNFFSVFVTAVMAVHRLLFFDN